MPLATFWTPADQRWQGPGRLCVSCQLSSPSFHLAVSGATEIVPCWGSWDIVCRKLSLPYWNGPTWVRPATNQVSNLRSINCIIVHAFTCQTFDNLNRWGYVYFKDIPPIIWSFWSNFNHIIITEAAETPLHLLMSCIKSKGRLPEKQNNVNFWSVNSENKVQNRFLSFRDGFFQEPKKEYKKNIKYKKVF